MVKINRNNEKRVVELIIKIIDINIYKDDYFNIVNKTIEDDNQFYNCDELLKLYLNEVSDRLQNDINECNQFQTLIEYLYKKHKLLFPTNMPDMISAKRDLKLWLLE